MAVTDAHVASRKSGANGLMLEEGGGKEGMLSMSACQSQDPIRSCGWTPLGLIVSEVSRRVPTIGQHARF